MAQDYPPHSESPLRQPKTQDYFANCREDVIDALAKRRVEATRILELGCSAGGTGEKLKRLMKPQIYVGIEFDAKAAEVARSRLDEVHVADLNMASPRDLGLADQRFDLLMALDVLEHLYDPWDVLARWAALLSPGGYVVVSVPNIQNVNIVQDLLTGSFTYTDAGLLDATHIRFFTRKTLTQLLTGAGFVDATIHPLVWDIAIDFNKLRDQGNRLAMGRIAFENLSREEVTEWLTYQYIAIARRPA
jgi:O-antigen biosynthesis protein